MGLLLASGFSRLSLKKGKIMTSQEEENLPQAENKGESAEDSYVPQPEDFLPTPKPPPTAFERMPRQGSALPGSFLVFLMTILSILMWTDSQRFGNLDVTKLSILESHQYWRLLSAVFVHGNMEHLLHNVPVFLFFSWILQGYFGLLASTILPLIIGVLSNGLTIYFYEDHIRLLGASGMIYGMVGLWLVLYVKFDRGAWWVKRVMRAIGFSLMVMFPQSYDPKVSYLAHFTGFACGIIFGLVFAPFIRSMAPLALDQPVVESREEDPV